MINQFKCVKWNLHQTDNIALITLKRAVPDFIHFSNNAETCKAMWINIFCTCFPQISDPSKWKNRTTGNGGPAFCCFSNHPFGRLDFSYNAGHPQLLLSLLSSIFSHYPKRVIDSVSWSVYGWIWIWKMSRLAHEKRVINGSYVFTWKCVELAARTMFVKL